MFRGRPRPNAQTASLRAVCAAKKNVWVPRPLFRGEGKRCQAECGTPHDFRGSPAFLILTSGPVFASIQFGEFLSHNDEILRAFRWGIDEGLSSLKHSLRVSYVLVVAVLV